jgi:hypothetical protein
VAVKEPLEVVDHLEVAPVYAVLAHVKILPSSPVTNL